jgi:hypothetical protein
MRGSREFSPRTGARQVRRFGDRGLIGADEMFVKNFAVPRNQAPGPARAAELVRLRIFNDAAENELSDLSADCCGEMLGVSLLANPLLFAGALGSERGSAFAFSPLCRSAISMSSICSLSPLIWRS